MADGLTISIQPVQLDVVISAPFIGISTSGPRGLPGGMPLVTNPTAGNFPSLKIDGSLEDSGYSPLSFATQDWVNEQGYATEAWVGQQGFAKTSDLSLYLKLDQTTPQTTVGTFGFPSVSLTNYLQVGTAPTLPTIVPGLLYWDASYGALSYGIAGGDITIGAETFGIYTDINGNLAEGDIVSIVGVSGNRSAVARTDCTNTASATACVGMVTAIGLPGNKVRVTTIGEVHGLNTQGMTEGLPVYVDPANPGKWTQTMPQAPNYGITAGIVTVANHSNGIVDVHVNCPLRLTDLADVDGTPLTLAGQIPVWDEARKVFDFTAKISDYLTISSAAATYQPIGAYITSIGTSTPTSITGLLKGSSGSVAAASAGVDYVAPGGAGTVTTIADVTLTAADLPTYAASANASTDVVTLTGKNPINGETYYIEGGTPPTFGDSVNRAFVNEWVGPVVYAVNSSGNTCKLSATSGGAALDITNAGSGWTLRRAGLSSVTVSSLATPHNVRIKMFAQNGINWTTTGIAPSSIGIRVNSDSSSAYRYGTSESTGWFSNSPIANVYCFLSADVSVSGDFVSGFFYGHGWWGTDESIANSTAVYSTLLGIGYYKEAFAGITSIRIVDANAIPSLKIGTRIVIERIGQ